jgi:hypothetical protein
VDSKANIVKNECELLGALKDKKIGKLGYEKFIMLFSSGILATVATVILESTN